MAQVRDDAIVSHRMLCLALFVAMASCASSVSPDGMARGADSALAVDSIASDLRRTDVIVAPDVVHADGGAPSLCGSAPCGLGEICLRGRCAGCCDVPPACVAIPTGCAGALGCGCFTSDPCGGCTTCQSVATDGIHCGNCQCTCAAPWTPIATPNGFRRIDTLQAGDLVYSVDHGEVAIVELARVGRRAVSHHTVVRVVLASGDVIEMSGGHPTADGRTFDVLAPGDALGTARVVSVETVPYNEPFTYDILPASDTATYFASGAWIGSTMR